MLDPQKISMGRVCQAYGLNKNEVEKTIQVLWPDAVFPVELWSKVHEAYWRAFADSNQAVYKIESPVLPEVDKTQKFFHTYLCSVDVMTFFRKLSLNVQASTLQEGLKNILQETYDDIDSIYPEERTFLFSTLSRLETVDIYDQFSPDSELFEEKILSLPISSYHFISHIFPETVVVDKMTALHYWSVIRGYPLKQEVKGITHDLVKSVIKDAAQGTPPVLETPPAPEEPAGEVPPQERGNIIHVPAAMWEGRPPSAIRDAMKSEYSDAVIAHVLHYWCGTPKTTIGNVLLGGTLPPDKMPTDDKTFRNLTNKLLKEAESLTIVKV
ncbi:MAG: hypothetical protein DELT_02593 [Desulfovibrio sp.]